MNFDNIILDIHPEKKYTFEKNFLLPKSNCFKSDEAKIAPEEPKTKEEILLEKARLEEVKGWSSEKQDIVSKWQNDLQYERLVNYFFVYSLKNKEGFWSWGLILISTIVSGISLVSFDETIFKELEITIKVAISVAAIFTTLIAAWIKKQNYVERIKIIDRYLTKLRTTSTQVENILSQAPWDRISYSEFSEHYQDVIVNLLATTPPMAPEEYKESVYILTKYYPELLKDKFPWYDEEGQITNFGKDVLVTYKHVKYMSCLSKIFSCFYCKSRCCAKIPSSIFEQYLEDENSNH